MSMTKPEESNIPKQPSIELEQPSLFDDQEPMHPGAIPVEEGGERPKEDAVRLPADPKEEEITAIAETLPTHPGSLTEQQPAATPVAPERHTKRNILAAVAALAVAAVGYLGVKALMSGDSESPKAQPVAGSTPTPGKTTSEAPTTPPETSTTTPTVTQTPTTPATTEQTPTTGGSETDTNVSLPASYFEKLIDPSAVDALTTQYPQLKDEMAPSTVKIIAEQRGITAKNIAAYETRFKKAFANPDTYRAMGDPQGVMSPSILSAQNEQSVIENIPLAADTMRQNIAQQLANKTPGVTPDLMNLVSLDKSDVAFYKQQLAAGHDTFYVAQSTDEVAVVPYHTPDGADMTLLVTVSKYTDGSTLRQYFVNIPIGDATPDIGADAFVSVPFDIKVY